MRDERVHNRNRLTNSVNLVRTVIAESAYLLRRGLVSVLSENEDIDVVGEVEHGDQVMPVALDHQPDVVLINSDLPGADTFAMARLLADRVPSCRILIMADRPRVGDLDRVVAARAHGLVLTEASPAHMTSAVRRVAEGKRFVDSDLAFAALDPANIVLTSRELDILRLIATGAPPHDIADDLHLAVGTVRNYLTRIIDKTAARNRIDAVRIASEKGWI